MQVGIFLTNQNPVGSDMVARLDEQLAMTRLARDRGWDVVASGQHYLSEGASQLQLVPFLSRLAAEAGHMTGVAGVLLLGLHNPVEVAETMASLDIIWGGRFVFGIGLGYREVEFDAFKVPRGQRVRRFESCLEIVKRLWTEDTVSVDSDVCTLKDVSLTCRPVQRPHPPIWVAANSDNAIRRAARVGDTWFINPHATMTTIARQMDVYRDELSRVGKPFPRVLPIFKEIYCARDRATALAVAGPHLAGKYKVYASWGQDDVMPSGESLRQPFESLLEDRFVIGGPEECYEQLRPCWEKVGATMLVLRTQWIGLPAAQALDSMRLISDELLPALRQVKTAAD